MGGGKESSIICIGKDFEESRIIARYLQDSQSALPYRELPWFCSSLMAFMNLGPLGLISVIYS